MRRFAILLVLISGCSSANGDLLDGFRYGRLPAAKHEMKAAKVSADPEPAPVPVPPQPTPPIEEPELPTLTLPENVEGDPGDFITIRATTNGTHVQWVAVDKGLSVFPSEMLRDSKATVVVAKAPGQYRMLAYTALNDVATSPVFCMVVIHGAQPPPPPPPPPDPQPQPPPPPPPPVTSSQLWIITIDNVLARTPEISAVLLDTNLWAGFKAQGHQWAKVNITDSVEANKFQQQIVANGGLPCVVILDANTKKWLNKDPADLKLPATAAGMSALVAKYSGK